MNTENHLASLLTSTVALYMRFGVTPTTDATLKKLQEEVRELTDAVVYSAPDEAIAEEAADCFVCVLGVLLACDIKPETLFDAIKAVIAKNNAKTWISHSVYRGLIVRRDKLTGAS